jgi:hypothetical protein
MDVPRAPEAVREWAERRSDTKFWTRIFVDHVDFVLRGLDQSNAQLGPVRLAGLALRARMAQAAATGNVADQDLCALKNWKLGLLHRMRQEWCGCLRPAMLHEMVRELEYFVAHRAGEAEFRDIVHFWNNDQAGHAALFDADLDFSETALKKEFRGFAESFVALRQDCGVDNLRPAVEARFRLQTLSDRQRDAPACRRFLAQTGLEDSPLNEKLLISALVHEDFQRFADGTDSLMEKLAGATAGKMSNGRHNSPQNPILSALHEDVVRHALLENYRGLDDIERARQAAENIK